MKHNQRKGAEREGTAWKNSEGLFPDSTQVAAEWSLWKVLQKAFLFNPKISSILKVIKRNVYFKEKKII